MDVKHVIAAAIKSRVRILLFTSSMLLCTTSHALPPEFTATYMAKTYGMIVAQAHYTLEHKNNAVSFSQHSEPVGLAALFTDDELDEHSTLSLHDNQLLLDKYSFIQKGDDKDRDIQLDIAWRKSGENEFVGTISGTARGETVVFEASAPVWDTLSFQIPVMMDTRENSPPQDYTILVKGKLKSYTFITHGVENIDIDGRSMKTIKVERQSDREDEPIFFWVAPELNNLPVKIEKWKKNKPGITMLLHEASFPSDSTLQFQAAEDDDNDFE